MNEPRQDRQQPRKRQLAWWWLIVPALLVAGLAVFHFHRRNVAPVAAPESAAAPPPAVVPSEVDRWREAARLVEEDRGQPIGRAAPVQVPAELRHYPDKKRFLALQVAGWMEQDYPIPKDEADLAQMIERGEMVEVPAIGKDHILYGVGANATGEPLAHYDRATGREIPLYSRYDLFEDAAAQWSATAEARKADAAAASAQAAKLPRAQARKRRALLAEGRRARQEAAALEKQRREAAAWYDDPDRRRTLVAERQTLDDLAQRLGKRRYDLDDAQDRRAFRGRLLSFLRPPARDRLLDLAARYHARFARPLPVTSLVRTEQYQRQLGETNPNATRISIPPHTTGLAYDVYYHYMPGPEQDTLMEMVAEDERAGRVESLRENRDHIHIFAFADGRRPPETLVAEAMGVVRRPRTAAGAGASQTGGPLARAATRAGPTKVSSGRAASRRKSAPVRRARQRARSK
ncbi:MAG: hypothetical protein DMF77_18815 [Acidobacteria bacterium]|nr:MAG: hypothetical protein DMF77_18815 [Acidobacteriota bacterium]